MISREMLRLLSEVKQDSIVYDMTAIQNHCLNLQRQLPDIDWRFAIKACPVPRLLSLLAKCGFGFDAASPNEISMGLATGVLPERIHYGNTIKLPNNIDSAYQLGIRDYVCDSLEDLHAIAKNAPGCRVLFRMQSNGEGALWGLSDKFGCTHHDIIDLFRAAANLPVDPVGVAIHVGSQQMLSQRWHAVLEEISLVLLSIQKEGFTVSQVNLGGGLPALGYKDKAGQPLTPSLQQIYQTINQGVEKLKFKVSAIRNIILEPGRHIVGDYGAIRAQVVRLSKRKNYQGKIFHWLYISCGKFNGLYETDQLQYRFVFPNDRYFGRYVPAVIGGPTCDSDDVINCVSHPIMVPENLQPGDSVWILSCGAYSTSYSTAFFNGFSALPVLMEETDKATQ